MMYLGAFLLLAVATGSVSSQSCASSYTLQKVVEEHFQRGCSQITSYKPPNLVKLDLELLSIVGSTLDFLTGLAFKDARVKTASVNNDTDGWAMEACIQMKSTCLQFELLDIDVKVRAPITAKVVNGEIVWVLVSKVRITAELNNKLNVLLKIVGYILKTIINLLTSILEEIVDLCILEMNKNAKAVKQTFLIAGSECQHGVETVTLSAKGAVAKLYTIFEQKKTYWESTVQPVLEKGELVVFIIHEKTLTNVFNLISKVYAYKVELLKELWSGESWSSKYSTLSLEVNIKKVHSCKVTEEGLIIELLLWFQFRDGETKVVTIEVSARLHGLISFKEGYCSSSFKTLTFVDAGFNIIFADSKCNCRDIFLKWFKTLCADWAVTMAKDLSKSSYGGELFQIPQWFGQTSNKGKCSQNLGYSKCSYLQ